MGLMIPTRYLLFGMNLSKVIDKWQASWSTVGDFNNFHFLMRKKGGTDNFLDASVVRLDSV